MIQQWPQEPVSYPGYLAPPTRPGRWATVTIIVASVISMVALTGCGFLGWKLASDRRQMPSGSAEVHAAAGEALTAAREFVTLMINVDYRELEQNTAEVLARSTGEFKTKYSSSLDQLRQTMVENRASAKGTVVDSAIRSEMANKVTTLMFVDQSVRNTAVPDGRLDRSRVQVTMENVQGRWLASEVDTV